MDEFRRSGRLHNGHASLAPNDILRRDGYIINSNRGDTPNPRDDIHINLRDVIGVSCQDVAYRPRVGTARGRAAGGATEGESESQHVRAVSDV